MTLTQTAIFTKKFLVGSAIFIFIALFSWGGYAYYQAYIYKPPPPPVPKPDFKFGKLPFLNLPANEISSSNYTYSIDTETGNLPKDFPVLVKVYFIPQLVAGFLAPDKARNLATKLDFPNGPEQISPDVYQFTDDLGGKIDIELSTGNFKYQHNVATSEAQENIPPLGDTSTLGENFKSFLQSKNLLPTQIAKGRTMVNYENGNSVNANQADISLWQNDIEKTPIVTPDFNKSLINSVLIRGLTQDQKYVAMNYTYWPIEETNFSTYPLKNIQTAFDELQSGRGFVAKKPINFNVSINKVYLAYLLTDQYSPYLQPVYVFEGNDFAGYVPAISDEYLSE